MILRELNYIGDACLLSDPDFRYLDFKNVYSRNPNYLFTLWIQRNITYFGTLYFTYKFFIEEYLDYQLVVSSPIYYEIHEYRKTAGISGKLTYTVIKYLTSNVRIFDPSKKVTIAQYLSMEDANDKLNESLVSKFRAKRIKLMLKNILFNMV